MRDPRTVEELLRWGAGELRASASPRLDAELLLSGVSGCSRLDLVKRHRETVPLSVAEAYRSGIARRRAFEPIAYILGYREFWGLRFEVTPDVLIPRPETEGIVERGIRFLEEWARDCGNDPLRVADLGTGSGCIAIALACGAAERGLQVEVTALDKSSRALEVARRNGALHNVTERVRFLESDWFSVLPPEARFDLVVANPPYVPHGAPGRSPELTFEPESALYAEGEEGTADIAAILSELSDRLAPSGLFLCEIGFGQAEVVRRAARDCSHSVAFEQDYAGIDRILVIRGDPTPTSSSG